MSTSIGRVLVMSFLALGALGFSQSPKTRDGVQGSETIGGYRLSPDGRVVLDPAGQIFLRPLPLDHVNNLQASLQLPVPCKFADCHLFRPADSFSLTL